MDFVKIIEQLDDFTRITLVLFVLALVIQFTYYLLVYLRVIWSKEHTETPQVDGMPPVSVIICARNEDENLALNLTPVLEQDYPLFEVIVVNDCSEDNTEQVLTEFKQKYPHLRSTIIRKSGSFRNGKKFAATVGIKTAQYEWLLFTDADCRPVSPQWMASMSRHFIDTKDIVLGYGGYHEQKDYLNQWIRYDACFNALQYFGFAQMGKAYTGVGRNLAYRKSVFFEHTGFAPHAHILSGDDALFVNQAATRKNVAMTCIHEAHTRSISKKTFREWIWQKRRQLTAGKLFRNSQIFWLALEPFSRILLWASFLISMIFCPLWIYILIVFIIRMIVFMWVMSVTVKRFNEPGILPHAIFFDFMMPFLYLYMILLNRISSKHNKWN